MKTPGLIGEMTMNHQGDSRVAATEEVEKLVPLIAQGLIECLPSKWLRTRLESNVIYAKENSKKSLAPFRRLNMEKNY